LQKYSITQGICHKVCDPAGVTELDDLMAVERVDGAADAAVQCRDEKRLLLCRPSGRVDRAMSVSHKPLVTLAAKCERSDHNSSSSNNIIETTVYGAVIVINSFI